MRARPAAAAAAAPGRWAVEIPGWLPSTLNELMSVHWAARARRKESDFEFILTYCMFHGVPRATTKRRVSLVVTLEKGKRRFDDDNVWKSLLDALVRADRLIDDGPAWCELGPVAYERGDRKGIRIELEDVP